MIDPQEIEDIESLESQLLGKGMSINDMVRHYAKLLLELVQNGKLKNISDEKLQEMAGYLKQAIVPGTLESNESLRQESFLKLWPMEKTYRESDPACSALARSVICCFGNESDWLRDGSGEETPLFYFYLYLKNLDPDAAQVFFEHFRKL
ncbi:hypothetical protein [Pseudomonas chlororaphis]|uniref:Uncharacterized protein n=1 Tax=Pseudomonas chlororaphis subsp. aurantiaca TaxID=86192 RepID=A0AAJ0ZPV7_9PSED|nr:hypothetical protein [Pseudomonas chlororaphis]AZD73938.1 hypothetical protein C4K16_3580 [Pseudomonas chlororaphis subsp. aurantiaca]MBU4636587.1 hypothetical protein [Pseudomonas chlororaphis subsp. aurantiaca]